jgi:hypothetical protein
MVLSGSGEAINAALRCRFNIFLGWQLRIRDFAIVASKLLRATPHKVCLDRNGVASSPVAALPCVSAMQDSERTVRDDEQREKGSLP